MNLAALSGTQGSSPFCPFLFAHITTILLTATSGDTETYYTVNTHTQKEEEED